jgi:hypothetical protein
MDIGMDAVYPILNGLLNELIISSIFVVIVGLWSYVKRSSILGFVFGFGFMMRMRRSGFNNFYCNRGEYAVARKEKSLEDYMLRAKRHLMYVGFYLAQGTDHSRLDSTIKKLLGQGCTVEIVLMHEDVDPDVMHALEEYLGTATGTLRARLAHGFRHFTELRTTLSKDQQGRLIVKRHQKMITSSAFLFDQADREGSILVDSKIWGSGRDKSYGMELAWSEKPTGMASELVESFRAIATSAM